MTLRMTLSLRFQWMDDLLDSNGWMILPSLLMNLVPFFQNQPRAHNHFAQFQLIVLPGSKHLHRLSNCYYNCKSEFQSYRFHIKHAVRKLIRLLIQEKIISKTFFFIFRNTHHKHIRQQLV